MNFTEEYLCTNCGTTWSHVWDTEDYNNDSTSCPTCGETAIDGEYFDE